MQPRRYRHFRGQRPPRFAHDAERELAELLDQNGLPWDYEPHTFPLAHDGNGRLTEAVTPDFYLPDAGLYIECTEMKPSLTGRKRRKLRKLTTIHGELVTYLDRRDFARLRAKYPTSAGRGTRTDGARRDTASDRSSSRRNGHAR